MEKLKKILSNVLKVDMSKVSDEGSRETIEEWDSFNHLLLICEIEKEMGIKFTMQEVGQIRTFRELKEIIAKKGCV